MNALHLATIEETHFLSDIICHKEASGAPGLVNLYVQDHLDEMLDLNPGVFSQAEIDEARISLTAAAWVQLEANEEADAERDRAWADGSWWDESFRKVYLVNTHYDWKR